MVRPAGSEQGRGAEPWCSPAASAASAAGATLPGISSREARGSTSRPRAAAGFGSIDEASEDYYYYSSDSADKPSAAPAPSALPLLASTRQAARASSSADVRGRVLPHVAAPNEPPLCEPPNKPPLCEPPNGPPLCEPPNVAAAHATGRGTDSALLNSHRLGAQTGSASKPDAELEAEFEAKSSVYMGTVYASSLPPEPQGIVQSLEPFDESLLMRLPPALAARVRRYQQKAVASHQALQQREQSLQRMQHAAAVAAIRLRQTMPHDVPAQPYARRTHAERSIQVKRSVRNLLAMTSAGDAHRPVAGPPHLFEAPHWVDAAPSYGGQDTLGRGVNGRRRHV